MVSGDEKVSDVNVYKAIIEKPDGTRIDLLNNETSQQIFDTMEIVESMFTPGVNGRLIFQEPSQIGEMLPLVGGEKLILEVETPNVLDSYHSLQFYIHNVQPIADEVNSILNGNIQEQSWLVEFSPYEVLYDNYVKNGVFEEESDDFVSKIATGEDDEEEEGEKEVGIVNFLAEKFFNPTENSLAVFDMDIEPTANAAWLKRNHYLYPHRKQVQQMSPIQLMNFLSERAVSKTNESATNYLFWQDFLGWRFRSIESIAKDGPRDRNYYIDNPHQDNLLDSFGVFIIESEYQPLEFIHSGAYISTYEKVSPDYDNVYSDFTSFYDAHKIETVNYSYQEEKDEVARIEKYPLITEDFDFEPTDAVRRDDTLYGYFSESHYNDQRTRLRTFQNKKTEVYKPDQSQVEPNNSYGSSFLWQPMFDQTEANYKTIREIVGIKRDLKRDRAKLAFKKDLKEKWSAYRCSVCCLSGLSEGSTGPIENNDIFYEIAAAGSFTDTVNYDPKDERANANGFFPSTIVGETPEQRQRFDAAGLTAGRDSYFDITMGELYNLKGMDEPEEEMRSVLFQIDATIYSLQRMAQSIDEQRTYCQTYGNYNNVHVETGSYEFEYSKAKDEKEEYEFTGNEYFNPAPIEDALGELDERLIDVENEISQTYPGGVRFKNYTENPFAPNNNPGDYSWHGAMHKYGSQSSPPKYAASYHGLYLTNIGGVHEFPCGGCYENTAPPPNQQQETGTQSTELFGGGSYKTKFTYGGPKEKDPGTIGSQGIKDVNSQGSCIINWADSAIAIYNRKAELISNYRSMITEAWLEFINKKVFVNSKKPYLDLPGGTADGFRSTLLNVKKITRKSIRGSRYEVFAVKEYLGATGGEGYTIEDYVPTYAVDEDTHPYYDQTVNTDIGTSNGLMSPSILLGLPSEPMTFSNQLVFPEGYQSTTSENGSTNESHSFEVNTPRYFALSGINNALLQSPEPILESVTPSRNVRSSYVNITTNSENKELTGIGNRGWYIENKINVDQAAFAYDWWFPASPTFEQFDPEGMEDPIENRAYIDYIKYAAQDSKIRSARFGDFYAPFTAALTAFFGNRNSYSEHRNVTNQPDSDDTRTGGMFDLYLRGGKYNASDVAMSDYSKKLSGYASGDQFGASYPGGALGQQDRFNFGFSQVENNPQHPTTDYISYPTYAGTALPGRVQQESVKYGAPFGPGNIDPLANNTFYADGYAKTLGMSNFGLSNNYDKHFYRDFGFPGEIIVEILPTSPSSSRERPSDPSEPLEPINDYDGGTTNYWNLDGSIQISVVGISMNGGRGGQLGYTKDFLGEESFDSPLYYDNGFLEYNVGPNYTNYCDYAPSDCSSLVDNYVNRSNWYAPSEPFKSPRRFFAEVQSYVRIEFENPIGQETLRDFPLGFNRDAGSEYYLPYLVQLTAGPFGRHSANYNISVIGMDPFGFDVAVTRTDKFKDYITETGTKPVLYPTVATNGVDSLEKPQRFDPLKVFYRAVTEQNQWAHISFNNFPIPEERLPSSWHSFKAPMSGVNPNSIFESHFQSLLWWDEGDSLWSEFTNLNGPDGEIKGANLLDGTYRRYAWGGKGFVRDAATSSDNVMWNYTGSVYQDDLVRPYLSNAFGVETVPSWVGSDYQSESVVSNIWRYDISGESEYGFFTPPEISHTLDDAKLDDYIHDLERNFSGQFVVYSKSGIEDPCTKYNCANPDGPVEAPVDNGEANYDPYVNCPLQELRPDQIEFEKYQQQKEDEKFEGVYKLLKDLTSDDFKEPTISEIQDLEEKIDECKLINERLGSDYLGCIYSDPDSPGSCDCPNQGPKFKDYLEASRTYATFWNTPDEAPLRREAQMIQLTSQKAVGVLPGDFSLRPGTIINVVNRHPILLKHTSKRSAGNWLVGEIKHLLSSNTHVMGVTLFRDGIPQDPDSVTEPQYTQD